MTHKIPDKFRQPTISTKEYVLLAVDVLKKQLVSLLLPSKMPYEVRQTEILQDLYITGQMIGCLPMTFESFCIAVNKKIDPYYRHWPRWGGWDRTGGTYRNGPKYRKNTDHLPKEKIEDEWRKHKQFERDKSRHHGRWGRPQDGISWYKTQSARQHRRWVQYNLAHANYDAFGAYEYKVFVDSYEYD